MKIKLVIIGLLIAIAINFVIAVAPLYSQRRSEICGDQECPNGGGPLCATINRGNGIT